MEENIKKKGLTDDYHKFSSHPIFKERYNIIKGSEFTEKKLFDSNLNDRFNFIRSKLFGFTEKNLHKAKKFLNNNYLIYTEAIIKSKEGKLKKSLKLLNTVLTTEENNSYILETKADILYSNGFFNEALLFYNKSLEKNSNNYYLKKRLFDINFAMSDFNNKELTTDLFNQNSFLLEIFFFNNDLWEKFKKIIVTNNFIYWEEYFLIKEKIDYNQNNNSLIKKMNKIKDNTSNKQLIKLINKNINILNEK